MSLEPTVHTVFEPKTGTWQYVVADPTTKHAVIIDSVLDFDPATNTVTTTTADGLLALVREQGLHVERILETHAHADHLTAAKYIQTKLGSGGPAPPICIGKRIAQVQKRFAAKFGLSTMTDEDLSKAFDKYWEDDEEFSLGELKARAVHLPGHTPDHMGYIIGSNVFSGDSLFNADVGSARCDFPDGDAEALYHSTQKILALPDHFKIYTGHDYPPGGSDGRGDPLPYMTVSEQRRTNKHLKKKDDGTSNGDAKAEFVNWRRTRDAELAPPRLINQSLQVNIRAGRLPEANAAGDRLLHIPVKVKAEAW